jgi:hypothetical protein
MAATPCRSVGAAAAEPHAAALASALAIKAGNKWRTSERSQVNAASPAIVAFIGFVMAARCLIVLTDPRMVRTGTSVATIADKAAAFQARRGAAFTAVIVPKALLSNNISR